MRETKLLQVALDQPGEAGPAGDPLRYHRENVLTVLGEAAAFDPDVVVFPELALTDGAAGVTSASVGDVAQPLPGPITDDVGEYAREIDSYVWLPTYERDGDDLYNSVSLIGRDGEYLGTYRKAAPTIREVEERGITPGTELPVWDTEFGRVGATICWDARFDELALRYRARELDLMVHPTKGVAHGKMAHWATYHGFHVAYCRTADARVFTPPGGAAGRQNDHPTMPRADLDLHGGSARFLPTTVNTDMESYAMGGFDYDETELAAAQRAYPDAIEIHSCFEDGIVVVESVDEDVPIKRIEDEFDFPSSAAHEDRGRDIITDAVDDSPLLSGEDLVRHPPAVPSRDGDGETVGRSG